MALSVSLQKTTSSNLVSHISETMSMLQNYIINKNNGLIPALFVRQSTWVFFHCQKAAMQNQ